ncbi:hypothetical protein [Deinococcus ruber]|uniref:Uncharacterized protein n=1 Tax=Deinococcus ruber TaxID=1848197 RepID=A0A918CDS7_9DEIO|nr:hypothetical protein [Deinococcus ruber]GGR15947.1 hypothetical protein GCM10008957_30860 [Deinococcus ruber]
MPRSPLTFPLLTVLFPLALLSTQAYAGSAALMADRWQVIRADAVPAVGDGQLSTETDWQRVQLPPQALAQLGDLRRVELRVHDLPDNLTVTLNAHSGPEGTIGVDVQRRDRALAVHQIGTFTLVNPGTGASYAFRLMVTGASRR